ncbi:DUF4145 domain-containing protein [[Eubacterium] tenue]|nr:DUF4145 domain-containing protein [[Eubacterium] tenue]MBC8630277.1 DUF4145 domain-containing protein [[Eubacterium] tenue]
MYKEPKFEESSFTCPYCKTIAEQKWETESLGKYSNGQVGFNHYGRQMQGLLPNTKIGISTCWNCKKYHVWIGGKMLIPEITSAPQPVESMPEDVKRIYNEAREVYPKSYKASAALLRLALQHLCKNLGEEGKNINSDIGNLVKKGLPVEVQQALDIIRVTGNNAVHPGEIDFEDNKEVSVRLFELLNFIVERMIVEPKKINDMFNWLPEKALKGIENRDNKK